MQGLTLDPLNHLSETLRPYLTEDARFRRPIAASARRPLGALSLLKKKATYSKCCQRAASSSSSGSEQNSPLDRDTYLSSVQTLRIGSAQDHLRLWQ